MSAVPRIRPWLAGPVLVLAACGGSGDGAPTTNEASSSDAPATAAAIEVTDEARAEALGDVKRGMIALRDGNAEGAKQAFRRATELDPGSARAHLNLGKVLVFLSDVVVGTPTRDLVALREAVPVLEHAATLDPDSPDPHYWLSQALDLLGDEDRAIEALETALALDPEHAPSAMGLAAVYVEQGEGELAKASLERAMELAPEDANLWFQYGLQLELDGNVPGARDAFQRSIDLDWTVPGPYSKLAVVLLRLGDEEGSEEATAANERWSEFGRRLKAARVEANGDRRDADAAFRVGALYVEAGREALAREWLGRALGIDAEHADARAALAALGPARPASSDGKDS